MPLRGRARSGLPCLLIACLLGCAPSTGSYRPCNDDDECARVEVCQAGRCRLGSPQPAVTDAARDGGAPPDVAPDDDGGDPDLPTDGGAPDGGPATYFVASPAEVPFGEPVALSWRVPGASACTVEGVVYDAAPEAEVQLARPASRPYTLRCEALADDGEPGEIVLEVLVSVVCADTLVLPDLVIGSDADLAAALPAGACVEVSGSASVTGLSSADLAPLYGLRAVGGDLDVGGNPSLVTLAGLEMLTSVGGDLRVGLRAAGALQHNPALRSLVGLGSLEEVGMDLDILRADALESLDGLERLQAVGDDIELKQNAALARLDGLKRLASLANDLEIDDAPSLAQLDGLDELQSVGGKLLLVELPELLHLEGLAHLQGELDGVIIDECDALVDLQGLGGITAVTTELRVTYNASLESLAGLEGITRAGLVWVGHNGSLASLAGLGSLEDIDGAPSACLAGACGGDLVVEHNAALVELGGLSSLASMRHDLVVQDNPALVVIDGPPLLTNVPNDLNVRRNGALTALEGFGSLAGADDINVVANPVLESFALPALTSVRDDLIVRGNGELPSLAGLSAVDTIGGRLIVEDNAGLAELGLSSLGSAGDPPDCARGCEVWLRGNGSLPSETAAALLEQIGRALDDPYVNVEGNGP